MAVPFFVNVELDVYTKKTLTGIGVFTYLNWDVILSKRWGFSASL